MEPLTQDHRVKGGREHGFLSRALGINSDLEIDYRTEPVEAGDVLLFTTDGVHDVVTGMQMISTISQAGGDLNAAARTICDIALMNGSTDNVTCQIVRIADPGKLSVESHLRTLTALPFPPELEPGMTFEGLNVLRELHTSSRSQVYLVQQPGSAEPVVLKTPSVNFEDDDAYIEMFSREEWIGRLVQSPHVLKIVQPPAARRSLYLLTEYFEGQTLRQWMMDNPSPPIESVRVIVEQIAKGLRAFHRKDIIHQDLKPENIMIDRNGVIKIIDFGSSRAASQTESGSPAVVPDFAGTVDYTAPEYHLGERGTNLADIYSLGVIAYEMLTGALPYGKGFSVARDLAKRHYVPVTTLRGDLPDWIDAALEKSVAKKPSERTEALSALVEDLRRPNSSLRTQRARPLIERDPLLFWRALAALLASVVAGLLVLLSRA